jgi:hypothetical protein
MTDKRGRRSAKSEDIRSQWQAARKFVQDQAFFDRLKGESVCRSTSSEVADHLTSVFGVLILGAVPDVDHGSVPTDSRGEGAFQLQITCPLVAKRARTTTFRQWKATTEYAKTKDILRVVKMLGHKSIQNTLLYTQLVNFEQDDYYSATAKNVEEAQKLVEAGFEFVCNFEEIKLFRKRK